jgi:hypothetical protein
VERVDARGKIVLKKSISQECAHKCQKKIHMARGKRAAAGKYRRSCGIQHTT